MYYMLTGILYTNGFQQSRKDVGGEESSEAFNCRYDSAVNEIGSKF